MTTAHKHQTIIQGAAEELQRSGVIRTYDAVYRWVCPDCGKAQRTTRLADTVYALRHAYGWEIHTSQEEGHDNLATYTLVKAGDMPGDEANGPHPRQLVGDKQPSDYRLVEAHPVIEAGKVIGYAPYVGKRVPIEAIPSPTRWKCERCGTIYNQRIGQPQLGGYRKGVCTTTGCSFAGGKIVYRIFIPVV